MSNFNDLTGKTFGRLRVDGLHHTNRRSYWNCTCSCGNKTVVSNCNLGKSTKSCGCLKHEILHRHHRLRPFESVYNGLVANAKARDISVNMSYDEFKTFTIIDKCFYCHGSIEWNEYRTIATGRSTRYNLDRTNNDLGYTVNNCVACCKLCNFAKSNRFSFDEWYTMTEPFRNGTLRKVKNNGSTI